MSKTMSKTRKAFGKEHNLVSNPPVKTPEEKAAQHLAVLIEQAGWNIKSNNDAVAHFTAELAKDPARAFEWSQNAIQASGRIKAAQHFLAIVEHCKGKGDGVYTDGLPPAEVLSVARKEFLAVVIRGARWPEHSTSPAHNYSHQCLLAATTEWLVKVDPTLGS